MAVWRHHVAILLSRNDIFMSGCGAVYGQGTNFLSKVICINDMTL